jgi:hypothetical protein
MEKILYLGSVWNLSQVTTTYPSQNVQKIILGQKTLEAVMNFVKKLTIPSYSKLHSIVHKSNRTLATSYKN